MRSAPGERARPLRRDAEDNRRRILVAAGRLFSQRGLDVGHDEIAKAAGVAVGTVYRRFPDKSALVTALFREEVEVVVTSAREALDVRDPWQAIVDFLTAVLALQADSQGLAQLISGSPHGHELSAHARAQIAPVVRQLVQRGHEAGVLRRDVVEQDLALVPLMVGAVISAARAVDPQLWRRALAISLDGLRPGRAPMPGTPATSEQIARLIQG